MNKPDDPLLLRREFIRLVGGTTGAAAATMAGCGGSSGQPAAARDGAADAAPRGDAGSPDGGASEVMAADGGSDTSLRDVAAADDGAPGEVGADAAEAGGGSDARDAAPEASDAGADTASDDGGPRPRVSLGEAMRAIGDFLNAQQARSRGERLANVLAFLRQRSDIVAAGLDDDGVWATFANRVPLMILENREPETVPPDPELDAEPLPPLAALVKGTVPSGLRARVINTMGAGFIDETVPVRKLLAKKSYRVSSDPGSVDSLKKLTGDSVLFFSAHGGVCNTVVFDEKGDPRRDDATGDFVRLKEFGVWTSTPFDNNNPDQYLSELQDGSLGVGFALEMFAPGTKLPVFGGHYWVTALFAERYWKFTKDSLVWIAACRSKAVFATPFVDACLDGMPGAALYVGWTADVTDTASVLGAKFVLDRLLGANISSPKETPPQRPFDYVEVWGDLRKRGLHRHPSPQGTTDLVYQARGSGDFSQLAPSLAYVLIDESTDLAILRGQFGNPPASERAVMIGALEATVDQWTETEIRAVLPRSGAGSSGEVYVSVRAHDSNVRRISEWTFNFRYRYWQQSLLPCEAKGPLKVRFRADIGEYRESPGTTPLRPVRYALGTRDSGGTITASGSHSDGSCTITWSGEGVLAPSGFGGSPPTTLISWMRIDPEAKQLALGLAFGLASAQVIPWTMTYVCPNVPTFMGGFAIAFGLLEELVELKSPLDDTQPGATFPSLVVALDDTFGTTAGAFEDVSGGDLHIRFDWDAVATVSPPDPKAAR